METINYRLLMNCSPDIQTHQSNCLKRSLSTESLERALKRARPFRNDSPITSVDERLSHHHQPPNVYPSNNTAAYTTAYTPSSASLPIIKSISISTKTHPTEAYRNMNGLLSTVHRERFGDPEERESWWIREELQEDEDEKMEEVHNEYYAVNAVLRQAHLQRKGFH